MYSFQAGPPGKYRHPLSSSVDPWGDIPCAWTASGTPITAMAVMAMTMESIARIRASLSSMVPSRDGQRVGAGRGSGGWSSLLPPRDARREIDGTQAEADHCGRGFPTQTTND